MTKKNRNKFVTTMMNFLRRRFRVSRLERLRNEVMRERMKININVVEQIEKEQLI